MEVKGGPCDQIKKLFEKGLDKANHMTNGKVEELLKPLKDNINTVKNLVHIENTLHEQVRVSILSSFRCFKFAILYAQIERVIDFALDDQSSLVLDPASFVKENTPHRVKAVNEFFQDISAGTDPLAAVLDAIIQKSFVC